MSKYMNHKMITKQFILAIIGISLSICTYAQEKIVEITPETLADAAKTLEDASIVYDPSYVRITYPGGDVPAKTGVCTDVVVRAFRKAFDWESDHSALIMSLRT